MHACSWPGPLIPVRARGCWGRFKLGLLALLVLQNSTNVLLLRFSRGVRHETWRPSMALLCSEARPTATTHGSEAMRARLALAARNCTTSSVHANRAAIAGYSEGT